MKIAVRIWFLALKNGLLQERFGPKYLNVKKFSQRDRYHRYEQQKTYCCPIEISKNLTQYGKLRKHRFCGFKTPGNQEIAGQANP